MRTTFISFGYRVAFHARFSRRLIARVTCFSRYRGCPEFASAFIECSIFLTGDGQTIRFSQVGTLTATDIRLIFQPYQVTSDHSKASYISARRQSRIIPYFARDYRLEVIVIFKKELPTKSAEANFSYSRSEKSLRIWRVICGLNTIVLEKLA